MKPIALTSQEARAIAAGTLTEIRRPVEDPPRFWDFMDGLDGVAHPTGYQCVEPSKGGVFLQSVDYRDPKPNRLSPFGAPGDLLWYDPFVMRLDSVYAERAADGWTWVGAVEVRTLAPTAGGAQ